MFLKQITPSLTVFVALAAAGCSDDANQADGAGASGGTNAGGAATTGTGGASIGGAGSGGGPTSSGGSPTSSGGSANGGQGGMGGFGGAGANGGEGGAAPVFAPLVVTFNTGTTDGLAHDLDPNDGYTSAEAEISNDWYGNGLAFNPAIEAARQFFETLQPDVVVFQEIFHPAECAMIPAQYHPGFVCETWMPGDPTVAQTIVGPGYQVVCNLGKPDKCAAVRTAFGTFEGCAGDLCLDHLDGSQIPNCGGGSRIGRGLINLVGGDTLTLVNVHGSSGTSLSDQQCRVAQVEQVFVNLGDGQPGVNGARNLVMGDLNTDPAKMTLFDLSANRWNDFVGSGKAFDFISELGNGAPATYSGLFNIDHVMSDVLSGDCWASGVTAGHPEVFDTIYFDHKAIVCSLTEP